jgi:hypothetical protein
MFPYPPKIWINTYPCRSQWPRCLRRRSAAARLLRSWVRIPLRAWMFVVSVVCCQVEISATSWPLVQRSPTACGASLCGVETSSMRSHNINPLWLVDQRDLPTGGDLITLFYKVRHPASTLVYRILGVLIADSINTKKKKDCWFHKYKKKSSFASGFLVRLWRHFLANVLAPPLLGYHYINHLH